MDCKQFREALDCYIDGELSADAAGAADAHRRECAPCERAVRRLLRLRHDVQRVVRFTVPPPLLERRVQAALRPQWLGRWEPRRAIGSPPTLAAVLVTLVLAALSIAAATNRSFGHAAAVGLDRLAIRLDDASTADAEGLVLCRDCELEHRYQVKASCNVIGHHGAIATTDGRIWNIVEERASADLIHDNALLGRTVQVRARFFRRAGAIEIESYRVQPRAGDAAERATKPTQVIATQSRSRAEPLQNRPFEVLRYLALE